MNIGSQRFEGLRSVLVSQLSPFSIPFCTSLQNIGYQYRLGNDLSSNARFAFWPSWLLVQHFVFFVPGIAVGFSSCSPTLAVTLKFA